MTGYRYLLDCAVAEEFFTIPSRYREPLLVIFRRIADDPYQPGEARFRDSSGREIQKRRFGAWTVSFWPGHAVGEVRIVGIQRVRQKQYGRIPIVIAMDLQSLEK